MFVAQKVIDKFDYLFDEDSALPAHMAGCIVRTAGHDFMDFRVDAKGNLVGGLDGCMNY